MKSMDAEELKKTLDVNERMVREKIQQIRTKKGLSMAEFGKLLGCERQTIFKYEKGLIKTIPLEVIIKIAQIGNTPPLDLLIPAFRARTPKAHIKFEITPMTSVNGEKERISIAFSNFTTDNAVDSDHKPETFGLYPDHEYANYLGLCESESESPVERIVDCLL